MLTVKLSCGFVHTNVGNYLVVKLNHRYVGEHRNSHPGNSFLNQMLGRGQRHLNAMARNLV